MCACSLPLASAGTFASALKIPLFHYVYLQTIYRSSWSKTNVLVGALALSDLLTVSCTTPTEIASVIHDLNIWVYATSICKYFWLTFQVRFEYQDFGRLGCVSLPFLQSAAILSNALILCLIAYDRYLCVVKMQPNTIKAKPGWPIVGFILAVWILSIGKNRRLKKVN